MSVFQRFVFPVLLCLGLLYFNESLIDISLQSKKVFLTALLFLSSIILLTQKNLKISLPKTFISIWIILFLLRSATLVMTRNTMDGIFDVSRELLILIAFVIISILYQGGDIHRRLKIPLLSAILLAQLAGIYQFVSVYNGGDFNSELSYEVTSFFSHRNLFAQILVFSLPFSISYSFGKSFSRWFSLLVSLISLALITILFCRSAWLALGISAGLTILIAIITLPSRRLKLMVSLSSVAMMALFVIVISSIYSKQDLNNQIHTITNWDYGSALKRIELWKGSWEMISDNPFAGSGTGDWRIDINKYIGDKEITDNGTVFYQRPHNDFLWYWSESGILVFLLFALLLILPLLNTIKNYFRNPSFQSQDFVATFGLLSFLIFSLISFPKERIEHQVFFVLFAYFAMEKRVSSMNASAVFKISLSLVLAVLLWWDISRFRAEVKFNKALALNEAGLWNESIPLIHEARGMYFTLDGTSTPLLLYSGIAEIQNKNYEKALSDLLKARNENPFNIHVMNYLGSVYFALGELDSAKVEFEKVLSINPTYNDAILNNAMVDFNKQDLDGAIEGLGKIDLDLLDQRQTQIIYVMLQYKLKEMAMKEDEISRQQDLHGMLDNIDWAFELFEKHIEEGRSFEEQVTMDLDFISSNEQ